MQEVYYRNLRRGQILIPPQYIFVNYSTSHLYETKKVTISINRTFLGTNAIKFAGASIYHISRFQRNME